MNVWLYVRSGLVVTSFLLCAFGASRRDVDFSYGLLEIAAAAFAFGVVGALFLVGIQAFNPRSDAEWAYPRWTLSPFELGQPLQFVHFCGYLLLAGGVGSLIRAVFVQATPLAEPVAFAFWGAGILVGVWCCCRLFKKKMART